MIFDINAYENILSPVCVTVFVKSKLRTSLWDLLLLT